MAKLISLPIKPKVFFELILILLFLTSSFCFEQGCVHRKPPIASTPLDQKLQICPEAWIVNLMPSPLPSDDSSHSYFILQGIRRERKEFDLIWVQQNCKDLKPDTVY